MAVASFNSNIAASGVLRRLDSVSRDVSTSFSRLSTGLRINKASDNAAGLAIADKLRVDARLSTQALRNVNDGISLINIIDSSLQDQSNVLTRLLELADQAANGTLSNTQRDALNDEYQALVNEFGRLGQSTRFNNLSPLNGGSSGLSQIFLQAGITGATTSRLGISTANTGVLSGTINYGSLIQTPPGDVVGYSTDQVIASFNNNVMRTEVTDSTGATRELMLGFVFQPGSPAYIQVDILGRNSDQAIGGDLSQWETLTSIVTPVGNSAPYAFQLSTDEVKLFFVGGSSADLTLDWRGLSLSNTSTTSAIDLTGVESSSRALSALPVLRARLTDIGQIRGDFGALASRLQSSAAVLSTSESNLISAESQIRDIDVAEEAANLATAQIRQQAAVATHQLAISQPELLLSLLTGS